MPDMPEQLRDAFLSAVGVFHNWAEGFEKTDAAFADTSMEIETVFGIVSRFREDADPVSYQVADEWAEKFRRGPEGLNHNCGGPIGKSYKAVGECFLRLCQAKEGAVSHKGSGLPARANRRQRTALRKG